MIEDLIADMRIAVVLATPGPWLWDDDGECLVSNVANKTVLDDGSSAGEYGKVIDSNSPDGRYIALCHPENIKAMLDALDASNAALKRAVKLCGELAEALKKEAPA